MVPNGKKWVAANYLKMEGKRRKRKRREKEKEVSKMYEKVRKCRTKFRILNLEACTIWKLKTWKPFWPWKIPKVHGWPRVLRNPLGVTFHPPKLPQGGKLPISLG